MTAVMSDFICPGGTLISSLRIWPREIDSRCRLIASRHQPQTSGVSGSRTDHACRVNSASERRQSSARTCRFSSSGFRSNLIEEAEKLAELVIGQSVEIDRNRAAFGSGKLQCSAIPVHVGTS